MSDTAIRRFCAPVIGPSSINDFSTASLPPAMLSLSGGSSFSTTTISTADMISDHGAPAISQSDHATRSPSIFSMKPTVSRFCAAAVWIPTFQMLVACATMIMMPAAMFERLSTPKAAMTPIMIGTTAALRAVALGTTRLSTIVTAIHPIRMRRVLVPTRDSVTSAMRRSSPVNVMAAAMNKAPVTSASAELAKPVSAMLMAADVPYSTLGSLIVGAVPSRKAISVVIMIALAS
ncbi:hypothetical protein D3C85_466300 [compost metagenome]